MEWKTRHNLRKEITRFVTPVMTQEQAIRFANALNPVLKPSHIQSRTDEERFRVGVKVARMRDLDIHGQAVLKENPVQAPLREGLPPKPTAATEVLKAIPLPKSFDPLPDTSVAQNIENFKIPGGKAEITEGKLGEKRSASELDADEKKPNEGASRQKKNPKT
jgi:hypothetical protein